MTTNYEKESDNPYNDLPECCCKGMEENEKLQRENAELKAMVDDLITGLEWYHQQFPEVWSTADDEKLQEAMELLK